MAKSLPVRRRVVKLFTGLLVGAMASLVWKAVASEAYSVWSSADKSNPAQSAATQADHSGNCADPYFQVTQPQDFSADRDAWIGVRHYGDKFQPPRLESRRQRAEYPEELERNRFTGTVLVYALIETDGSIKSTKALCANDQGFIEAAEQNVMGYRASPAYLDGKAIRIVAFIPVTFSLDPSKK